MGDLACSESGVAGRAGSIRTEWVEDKDLGIGTVSFGGGAGGASLGGLKCAGEPSVRVRRAAG